MSSSMVTARTSKRPPGMNPASREGSPGGATWTSAISNAGVVEAGWPNAALDNKPDKRMGMAHGCFIIRSPKPRRAFGRARGQVVSTIDHHTAASRRFLLLPEETQLAEKHGPYDPIAPFDPPFCPAARCNSLIWQTCRYGKGTAG